jgi:hypothetical protein
MKGVRFALSLCFLLGGCGSHPSDASLRSTFIRNEGAFTQLIQMAHEDSQLTRIAPTFTWPDHPAGFTDQRWNVYRSLFRELRLQDGIGKLDNYGGIVMYASSLGMVNRGSAKGYAYSTRPVDPLAGSLDGPSPCAERNCVMFKPLKTNWYLFFER